MPGRLIVFDLDDTLYEEAQFVRSGFRAVSDWLATEYGISDFYTNAVQRYENGARGNIFDEALTRCGVPEAAMQALIPAMVAHYRAHHPCLTLYEDAAWALDYAAARATLGLLTDGYAHTQRNKVAALGIAPHFAAIVYSDDAGRDAWKPSPIPYQRMMQETGFAGPDCCYIADNPKKDFIAPRALGWKTINIQRPQGEYAGYQPSAAESAEHQIATLYDLEAYL